jgi:hypothetical protein
VRKILTICNFCKNKWLYFTFTIRLN